MRQSLLAAIAALSLSASFTFVAPAAACGIYEGGSVCEGRSAAAEWQAARRFHLPQWGVNERSRDRPRPRMNAPGGYAPRGQVGNFGGEFQRHERGERFQPYEWHRTVTTTILLSRTTTHTHCVGDDCTTTTTHIDY
jgi:hypothetical protein